MKVRFKTLSAIQVGIMLVGYFIGYLVLYLFFQGTPSQFGILHSYILLGDILLLGGASILIYYRRAEWRWYWILIAIAIGSHMIGDIQLFTNELHFNGSTVIVQGSTIAYFLSNVFLLASLLVLIFSQKNRLHIFQLLLDAISTLALLGLNFWYAFGLEGYLTREAFSFEAGVIFTYLSIDIILIVVLMILYQVYRQFRLSKTTIWLITFQILGFMVFCLADFIEFYFIVKETVGQYQYLDLVWLAGFAFIIFSGFLTLKYQRKIREVQQHPLQMATKIPTNIGAKMTNHLYLLTVLAIVMSGFDLVVMALTFLIVGIRYFISKYLEIYLRNQILLEQYKNINNELEEIIEKRTQEIVEKNHELEQLANYDMLTGLPNSRYLSRYLNEQIAEGQAFAFLFTDLDRFKVINDWYGHDRGDALLQAVTKRLQEQLPPSAFLARQGGDEFVIILPLSEPVTAIAQGIIQAFQMPFSLLGQRTHTTISIGISCFPADAKNIKELVKFADLALYEVKNLTKNNFAYYDKSKAKGKIQAFEIEHELYSALSKQQFILHYQPQFDLQTRKLVGCEALIRWQHPTLGMISPLDFIPIAEDIGLIHEIGEWVLVTSLQQLKQWQIQTDSPLKLGVNLSPKQLQRSEIVSNLSRLLIKWELSPAHLELEVTESSLIHEKKLLTVLYKLQLLGINIAIDDFGTGYSSLGQLKRLPIQTLKIARELVADLETNRVDQAIVEALLQMAKKLKIHTIAEGIETESELQLLKQLGCEQAQGYYFGRPVPATEFAQKYLGEVKKNDS